MIFDVFGTLFIFRVFLHFFFLQNRKKGNNFEKQRKRNDKRKSAYYVKCNSFILIKSTKTKGQRTDYFFFRLIYHWCYVIRLCTSIFLTSYIPFILSLSDHHLGLGHMGRGRRDGLKGYNFLFYYYICRSI